MATAMLAVFAFGICLAYGHLGLNPLDQSIVFDGAWRLVSGQLPVRDFTTPIGFVPIAIQAALFSVFGLSWFVYCVHAAFMNAAFAVVALRVARRVGVAAWPAWFVAVASAVVFYPPIGVPFSDQHSFFFALCCLWATLVALGPTRHVGRALFAVPLFAALALLSKPVPAVLVVGPCLSVAAVAAVRKGPRWFAAGVLLPVLTGVLYLAAIHASISDAVFFTITLPYRTATARTVLYPGRGAWALVGFRLQYIAREWRTLAGTTCAVVLGLWIAAAVLCASLGRDIRRAGHALACLGLSIALACTTGVFTYVTNNAVSNAAALLPLVVGLAWTACAVAWDAAIGDRGAAWRTARRVLPLLVVLVCGIDLWRFHLTVNVGRAQAHFDRARAAWSPGGRLGYLRMQHATYRFDLRDILPYIAARPDNFLLFGDAALLYGATGHPSVFPALWLHEGLTVPPFGSGEFQRFESRVLSNMERYHVRYLIQEDLVSHMNVGLDHFPRVVARVSDCPTRMLGEWTVREVCR
jgi:hypothetical protein